MLRKVMIITLTAATLFPGIGLAQTAIQDLQLGCVKPVYIIADDLNRDGYPDLALACHSCNTVMVVPNQNCAGQPCGALAAEQAVAWKLADSPLAVASARFMDPPKREQFQFYSLFPNLVAVTQYQPGVVRFSPLEPKNSFLEFRDSPAELPVNRLPFATLNHIAIADLDKDGMQDVVLLDGLTPQLGIYLGNRSALQPPVPGDAKGASLNGAPGLSWEIPAERAYFLGIADFDRNGLPDIVVAAGGKLYFYQNLSDHEALRFEPAPNSPAVTLGTKVVSLTLADFNRDGYVDIAAVDPEFGALSIVLNRGCWGFEVLARIKMDGEPVSVVSLDCDRNGLVDLAVAEYKTNRVTIVLNRLTKAANLPQRPDPCQRSVQPPELVTSIQFVPSHSFSVANNPISLAVADFDVNGMPDVAVAIHGADGEVSASGTPEAQVIYNPCCCADCSGSIPCCPSGDNEQDVCPEQVGASPKG